MADVRVVDRDATSAHDHRLETAPDLAVHNGPRGRISATGGQV